MKLRPGTPEDAGISPAKVQRLKELARSWVEDGTHHALVLLVARRGIIILHEAFGTLRPEPGSPPVLPDSIFALASSTKPVTAAAVMLLVEEGRVGLMRPIREYFPEISARGADEVLVHHLLTHLSGWRDIDVMSEIQRLSDEGGELPPPEPGQDPDIAESLYRTRGVSFASRPGEAMQYCNHNYQLLGELVRRSSGTSIEHFGHQRIFEPLGMTDSSYVLPPEHRARKVRRGEGMPGYPDIDSEGFETCPRGGGGVHSTARDMAVFAQMLLNGGVYDGRRVLSSAAVQAMQRNHVPEGVPARWDMLRPDGRIVTIETPGAYGYGLFPYLDSIMAYYNGGLSSRTSFGHVGFGGTGFWADPELDLVGVYFSIARRNLLGNIPDWRADLFADAVAGAVED